MLGNGVQEALEKQERNKAMKKQIDRERNLNKNKEDKDYSQVSNISNNTIPVDSIPGDTIEFNAIKINKKEVKNQPPDKNRNKNKEQKIMKDLNPSNSSFNL